MPNRFSTSYTMALATLIDQDVVMPGVAGAVTQESSWWEEGARIPDAPGEGVRVFTELP